MATVATRTTVRVVCNNTLTLAVGADGQRAEVRISHNAPFNAEQVRGRLGLELGANEAWDAFSERADKLASTRLSKEDAVRFYLDVFYPGEDEVDINNRTISEVAGLALSAPGQRTEAADGTAWGLVNAVTYFIDHARKTKTDDSRVNRAWFGDGEAIKRRAFVTACELAEAA
jgi:phage/plasmid-like protein (TIGR03299 family)